MDNQVKMLGNIKWYKPSKGYGYIIGSDDETYFFELINCLNKDEIFNENDKVLFIPHFETELIYADKVERSEINVIN